MGMYTSVIHPKDGRELQIKTGDPDLCETYKVGAAVPFYVNKEIYRSGGIFDDVYGSYSDKGPDDWVIVKNGKILAVRSRRYTYPFLRKYYKIKDPKKTLWTKAARDKRRCQEKISRKKLSDFKKSVKHLPKKEQLAIAMAYPLVARLDKEGLARNFLKVEALHE